MDGDLKMSAKRLIKKIRHSDSSMENNLPSSEDWKNYEQCSGNRSGEKKRKGIKKATSAARRRNDKKIISENLND